MIHYIMSYPGDPPSEVIEMTRAEFQERFRPSSWSITNMETGEGTTVPIGAEDIQCDLCSTDPGDTMFVWLYGSGGCRGYCRQCFERMRPYCTVKE